MTGKQLAAATIVIVLALVVVSLYHTEKTSEVSTSEFTEIDDSLSDLESFLDFENQEYDFSMEELYTGWS